MMSLPLLASCNQPEGTPPPHPSSAPVPRHKPSPLPTCMMYRITWVLATPFLATAKVYFLACCNLDIDIQHCQNTAVWSVLLALVGEQTDFVNRCHRQRRRLQLHLVQQSFLYGCRGNLLLVCQMLQFPTMG